MARELRREPPAVSNCGIWKNPVQNDISKPIMAFIIIIILRLWPQSNDTVSSTFLSENISARREWGRQPVAIWTLHSFQLGIYCQLLAFRKTETATASQHHHFYPCFISEMSLIAGRAGGCNLTPSRVVTVLISILMFGSEVFQSRVNITKQPVKWSGSDPLIMMSPISANQRVSDWPIRGLVCQILWVLSPMSCS